jgi:excisionase family DNA binding protein
MKTRDVMTEEETTQQQLMTVQEVAREMRVHDTTVRRWIYAGLLRNVMGLPAGKSKRMNWRIPRASLAAMVINVNAELPVLPA